MRITTLMILIVIVALMFVGQTVYQSDLDYGKTRDIYNFTESNLQWNHSIGDKIKLRATEKIEVDEYNINIQRIWGVLGEGINFIGYSVIEMTKWALEFGYTHPDYDLKFFMDVLIKILWLTLIIMVIPLLVPIAALVYLIFKGIYLGIKKIFEWILKDETKPKKTKA